METLGIAGTHVVELPSSQDRKAGLRSECQFGVRSVVMSLEKGRRYGRLSDCQTGACCLWGSGGGCCQRRATSRQGLGMRLSGVTLHSSTTDVLDEWVAALKTSVFGVSGSAA